MKTVFQDEWSLMTEVAQDSFYCICMYDQINLLYIKSQMLTISESD